MKKNFIENQKYNECSGVCTYYEENIGIRLNKYGYYEEFIIDNNRPIKKEIFNISPAFNEKTNEFKVSEELFKNEKDMRYSELVGFYLENYVGYANEANYRKHSSSGGIGSWILKELLNGGHVDAVIHVKQNKDKKSQQLFKYDISYTEEEIKEGAKTKYYPVEMSEILKLVKENDKKYAIVGIPSFIFALRLLSEYDEIINKRIIFTIGLICGHQKSLAFTELMAWEQGIKPGNLNMIDYRIKYSDRPANNYGVRLEGLSNGKQIAVTIPTNEISGQDWGKGYFRLEASDYTDDIFNQTADITVGDAWLDEYKSDSRGHNIVIIRNETINHIFSNAIREKRIIMDKVSPDTIIRSQKGHVTHSYLRLPYRLFLKRKNNEWYPLKTQKPSKKFSFLTKKIIKIRLLLSKKSHEYFLEAKKRDDLNFFYKKMRWLEVKYKIISRLLRLKKVGPLGIIKIVKKKIKS